MQAQLRLLPLVLKEQYYQGPHCLLFCLHIIRCSSALNCAVQYKNKYNYVNFLKCPNFKNIYDSLGFTGGWFAILPFRQYFSDIRLMVG